MMIYLLTSLNLNNLDDFLNYFFNQEMMDLESAYMLLYLDSGW
jgi:hypothetical protein